MHTIWKLLRHPLVRELIAAAIGIIVTFLASRRHTRPTLATS